MSTHMRRREFITLLGGAAAAWPVAARAQQDGPMKRISFVAALRDDDAEGRARLAAFRQGLAALGWIDGRNIQIVEHFGIDDLNRIQTYVAEMLRRPPDVIVTANSATVSELKKETYTNPIVITNFSDPVALGFAESLARPGGNVTGFTSVEPAMATKWLELLKDITVGLSRVTLLLDPQEPTGSIYVRGFESAASAVGIQPTTAAVRDDAEVVLAINAAAREPNGGLIVPPVARLAAKRELIFRLAARNHLPAVYAFRYMALDGGLMSYGPDVLDLHRRTASYVDRILKGVRPADLPIQLPTKFELVVNLKTAKAIGLTIPESFLLRADEVIE